LPLKVLKRIVLDITHWCAAAYDVQLSYNVN